MITGRRAGVCAALAPSNDINSAPRSMGSLIKA
jgi:hypothetical protein